MWAEISLSLITSIGEVICKKFLAKSKQKGFDEKLRKICETLFSDFANTSLDNDQFFEMISSCHFKEMLRNYFYTLTGGLDREEYRVRFIEYITGKCPMCNSIEIDEFIGKIEKLYFENLQQVITENYELNTLYQLMIMGNREIISKVIESKEVMLRYINSLDKEMIITQEEIINYHNNCKAEFSLIKFTGISGVENKKPQNLNEFYVQNTFSFYNKEIIDLYKSRKCDIETINLNDFFRYNNKVILIGGAGLGKSTTLNYIFCNYEEIFEDRPLKLKIDLKEYAKDIAEDKKSLLWCLSNEFSKRIPKTKSSINDIELLLSQFLEKGKTLVILDALDEIPIQSVRNKVRDEIANFTNIYFLNRYIISTREAGYLRNRFDESFLHIKINDFNDEQIQKYSHNWCNINNISTSFADFWEKFYIEVERSKCINIIRNPIVLILALVIFDIEKNLPNRRVEFYKKCIDTFLEVRENRKSAFVMDLNFKNILGDDSIVPKIAYYKFDKLNKDMAYKFTNDELNNAIIVALEVYDTRNWFEPAKQFAKYLINRTELIKEIDENILEFTHKTFFEYFLAVYFSREYINEELLNLLIDWIGDSNYDELASLIIEVIVEKNDTNQHKQLITFLFEKIQICNNKTKQIDIFVNLARLYKNGMLQPKFHQLYNKCILYNPFLTKSGRTIFKNELVIYDSKILAQVFTEIIAENSDNLSLIIDSLFYLNSQFRSEVIKLNDSKFEYIVRLFSIFESSLRKTSINRKTYQTNFQNLKQYFIFENTELILAYPQIFLSYIGLICSMQSIEIEDILFKYSFKSNNFFQSYSNPKILRYLFENSLRSWKHFLLLLICIVHCSNRPDWFFEYAIDAKGGINEKRNSSKEYTNNIEKIMSSLKETINFYDFVSKIADMRVYNENYFDLYSTLYSEYKMQEKHKESPELITTKL